MAVIDDFLSRYRREYDYYQQVARLCAQMCEAELEQNGVRAIVTNRAKRPDRLRAKIEQRNKTKKYATVETIYEDLVDLAGVRIALYFPGDTEEVERLINAKFSVRSSKEFPRDSNPPAYKKRFSGYAARHYRVNIPAGELLETEERYSEAQIEIQVASVLVHAWSEVEHDLVYKPLSGKLSEDEYAILDELNGLVLAGEIALERLQRAAEIRLKDKGERFGNHYELASYIYGSVSDKS
jgi:ppGpp synthetase/RelA/SpoT-type nucleotidyltranferase